MVNISTASITPTGECHEKFEELTMVKDLLHCSPWAFVVGVCAIFVAEPSYAYIDPGTGSIILQSVLAGAAVAAGLLRTYWHRVRTFFGASDKATGVTESSTNLGYSSDADTRNEP